MSKWLKFKITALVASATLLGGGCVSIPIPLPIPQLGNLDNVLWYVAIANIFE
jgi:hypothetical protein